VTSTERINFADIEDQKDYEPVPRGRYTLELSDIEDRYSGENAKNPGARMLNCEFTVQDNEEYGGQKVWDLIVCVPKSLWKAKGFFAATEKIDVSNLSYDMGSQQFTTVDDDGDEVEIDVTELIGTKVEAKVGIQPATREQEARNKINTYYPHEDEDDTLS